MFMFGCLLVWFQSIVAKIVSLVFHIMWQLLGCRRGI